MTCEAYRDMIAAHVDGQLTLAERHEAERHLAGCTNCSLLFADQHRFRRISHTWHWETPIPLEVEHRLRVAIAAESSSPLRHWWQTACAQIASFLRPPQVAFVLGATTVLLLMLVLPKGQNPLRNQMPAPEQGKRTEQAVLDAAVAYYRAVRTGELPLAYATNNPRELETALRVSERLNFSIYVPDLRPAGYELNGGIVVDIDGKPTVITVYQGAEGQIVCLRQRGTMPPPPKGARRLPEQEYLDVRPGQTALYKQLPGQFRVIVSGLPAETFLLY